MSLFCHWERYNENMEKDEKLNGKPMKFILHIAKHDDNWVGKAISFEQNKEMKFNNLIEFRDWLDLDILKIEPENEWV